MQVTSLGYRTDIALLELGGTRVDDHGDHLVVSSPHAPTFWWGNFLLLAQVPSPETSARWLERFAAAFPDAKHVAIGFDGIGGTAEDLAWFADHGFNTEALAVMKITTIPAPQHPNEHAKYRTLETDDDWAQSVELRLRSHDPEPDQAASRAFATARAATERRLVNGGHGAWFGAFIGERLVAQLGLLAAGAGLARFQSVETDPDHRRRGLGGSLIHRAGRYGFDELGAGTLVMVAEPNYVAVNLYRALGFETAETQLMAERKPATT
jgi:ribosomal protein S18 acetylase RimI-like enzyme